MISAKPDPPDSIEIVNFTHNSVTLKWNAGFSGGLVQHYRVRYKIAQGSQGYTQVDVQPKTSTVFTVRGILDFCYFYILFSFTKKNIIWIDNLFVHGYVALFSILNHLDY
jgi:hypothetical protein